MIPKYTLLVLIPLFLSGFLSNAQDKKDIEALAAREPKKAEHFPVNYGILLPRPETSTWESDYARFEHFVTPTLKRTQLGLSSESKGAHTWICVPSVRPHAQLDTSMIINDPSVLEGTWRNVSFRKIRFQDSVSYSTHTVYRTDTTLVVNDEDDAFVQFGDQRFRMLVKEKGHSSFKQKISAKYQLESGRYLMLYKFFKSGSGISQVGIDKNGRLFIHYATVIEEGVRGAYINYFAVIDQMIFEKVR